MVLPAGLSTILQADYASEDLAWNGSPFAWIRARPARQRGAIGEMLVAGWCAARGFDVVRSPNSDADRVIEGLRVEIKFSTLWQSGVYKFQQIRDQNYDVALLLGISPFDAKCWVVPKSDIMAMRGEPGGPTSQHGGSKGRDTMWLSFPASRPPAWLARHGGRLADAAAALSRLSPSA